MRALACFMLTLVVGGCGVSDGLDPEARRCGELPDITAYSQCIEIYNARVARDERQAAVRRQQAASRPVQQWAAPVQQANTPNEDTAALLLMGATAFSNGYTQAQTRPMLTCFNTGMMTMCQ